MKYVSICVDWEKETTVDRRLFDMPSDAMRAVFDEMRAVVANEFEPDDPDFTRAMSEIDAMKFTLDADGSWFLDADDCRYIIAPINA